MSINNKYTGFEKMLHDKVNNFEFPYDNRDWNDFEKKLPKSPKSFTSPKNIFRYLIATSAAVVSTLIIVHFTNNNNKPIITNNNSKTQAVADNNRLNNSLSTNTNINNTIQTNNKKTNQYSTNNNSTENRLIETVDNNKQISDQKNITENNNHQSNPVNKEPNTASNQNENKNIPSSTFLIYADVVDGCAPLNVQFNPSVSSDSISYLWVFGDHQTSTLKAPSHTYNKSGVYTVSLLVKYAKSQQTKKITYSKNINVHTAPTANFDYSVSDDGYDYSFANNSTDAVIWNWNFGDKFSTKEKSAQHSYKHEGSYDVQLIAYNNSGCADTITKILKVKFKAPFFIPNSFVPAGVTPLYGPIGENMNTEGYKMTIYDINSKQVFETTNIDIKWDGKLSGTGIDAKAGYYYWKISMRDKNNIPQEWSGTVILMR